MNIFLCFILIHLFGNEIEKCILDEDTIADNASGELSSIRRKQKNIEENIKNKLNSFIHSRYIFKIHTRKCNYN